MAISPSLTFRYQFSVQCDDGSSGGSISSQGSGTGVTLLNKCWNGSGIGQASFGGGEGIVGPRPRFELCAGWLTLLPTDGWTQSFPTRWFSDIERPPQPLDGAARLAAIKTSGTEFLEAQKEAQKLAASRSVPGDFASYTKALKEAMADALRRRGRTRDLASYAIFVGEALGEAFRIGDEFRFSRDGNGDFRYSVVRNLETVFSAGSVGRVDDGGPMAIWQEYDSYPNPNAETLKMKFPEMRVAESIDVHRPYISVRVKSQTFHLLDGQDVHIDPSYVFLARSNKNVPAMAFEFTPRAVHSAGLLTTLGKELIIDAARKLTAPLSKIL
jgi:hypothetical protein